MMMHDPRCSDSKSVTKLDRKLFVGGGHGNENGNVVVCGNRSGLWSFAGFPLSQLDAGSPSGRSPPSAVWSLQQWTLRKRCPTGRELIVIARHVERLQRNYELNGLGMKRNGRGCKTKAYQEVFPL